jgi:hypothetical protein
MIDSTNVVVQTVDVKDRTRHQRLAVNLASHRLARPSGFISTLTMLLQNTLEEFSPEELVTAMRRSGFGSSKIAPGPRINPSSVAAYSSKGVVSTAADAANFFAAAFLAGAVATVTFLAAADFAATFFVATFGVVIPTFLTVVPSVVFLLFSLFAVTFFAAAFFVGLVAPAPEPSKSVTMLHMARW